MRAPRTHRLPPHTYIHTYIHADIYLSAVHNHSCALVCTLPMDSDPITRLPIHTYMHTYIINHARLGARLQWTVIQSPTYLYIQTYSTYVHTYVHVPVLLRHRGPRAPMHIAHPCQKQLACSNACQFVLANSRARVFGSRRLLACEPASSCILVCQ